MLHLARGGQAEAFFGRFVGLLFGHGNTKPLSNGIYDRGKSLA
jgi:hypothetical protein